MFADDVKIWSKIRNVKDSKCLQDDLHSLSGWSNRWLLGLSVEKCNVMHVGHNIPTSTTFLMAGKIRN